MAINTLGRSYSQHGFFVTHTQLVSTSRYRIERIVEFYASTEGNVNMVNNTGMVGAVGVIPWFAEMLYPILLLKVDAGELVILPYASYYLVYKHYL